jgi:hypothetical protein
VVAKWVRSLFSRPRRPSLAAPPLPDPEGLHAAREEARRAGEVLKRVSELDPVVTEQADRAEQLYRRNNLGPGFWAWAESLGEHKRA